MLKGKAKADYQREYMRRRRSNEASVRPSVSVRPGLDPSPMMVGYVPPEPKQ